MPNTNVRLPRAALACTFGALPRADPRGATSDTSVRASASANSFVVAQRSAGNFDRAFSTAASTLGVTVSRTALGAIGFSVSTFATIDCTVAPLNGGSPVSISYVTAPSA